MSSLLPKTFRYAIPAQRLELTLTPSPGERWQAAVSFGAKDWQAALEVVNGQMSRIAPLLPKDQPQPTKGVVNGRVALKGRGTMPANVDGTLTATDLAFADSAGLHAAEKLAGVLAFSAQQVGDALQWRAELTWDKGELFWAPLYFPNGGQRLAASGTWAGDRLHVDEGTLHIAGVGEAGFALDWRQGRGIEAFTANASALDASGLYSLLLKPYLDKTALDQLTAKGRVGASLTYADGELQAFDISIGSLGLVDGRKRFSVENLEARVPWRRDSASQATISVAGGSLLSFPIGAFTAPLRMRGYNLALDELTVPVLDGQLLVRDLAATREADAWRWNFSGVLLPVSMAAITKALGLPAMGGVLAATVPKVTYREQRVTIDGGVGIRLFDGDVSITGLSLLEPLSAAPRLNADVEMRNLDLGLLTKTFKFGSIEGRIDADIKGLELSNWKPVKFDARIASSPGDYRRKISQQAVQNISALGGAGAAAAIQRSVLRLFEDFGYQKIGLSCRLSNNVCEMSGVESAPQGYVIVKGGGIPAITVTGYNRYVGWNELLDRLARVIEGNATPVIK